MKLRVCFFIFWFAHPSRTHITRLIHFQSFCSVHFISFIERRQWGKYDGKREIELTRFENRHRNRNPQPQALSY